MSSLSEKLTQHHPEQTSGRIGVTLATLKKQFASRWGAETYEGGDKDPSAITFKGMRTERWVRVEFGWYERDESAQ